MTEFWAPPLGGVLIVCVGPTACCGNKEYAPPYGGVIPAGGNVATFVSLQQIGARLIDTDYEQNAL